LGNVVSHDSISVNLGIESSSHLLSIGSLTSLVGNSFDSCWFVTWESVMVMWNVDTSISSSFQSTEESGTSGSSLDSDIKESLEWSLIAFHMIGSAVVFTIKSIGTLVITIKLNLLQQSSGEQKTSAVRSRVICKTGGKSHISKFR